VYHIALARPSDALQLALLELANERLPRVAVEVFH
jgi:hypothetical protein